MSNVAKHDDVAAATAGSSWLSLADSINAVSTQDRGRVILSGSHGGLYAAFKGLTVRPRGLVFNDAGGGLNNAGLAALQHGESVGVAVATVGHASARIGDARDMLRRGVISHANAWANASGVEAGMVCSLALEMLAVRPPAGSTLPDMREHRREITLVPGHAPVICIDSASLIQPSDAGRIVVTGSHGGLIGGNPDKAVNVACAFAVFNDAGIGREAAGLGRLAPLDSQGIAAVTVGHMSAEIGNAASALATGVISFVNRSAERLGAYPGMPLRMFLTRLGEALPPPAAALRAWPG